MVKVTNIHEAEAALSAYISPARERYSLTNMLSFMEYLGNPQNRLKIIHVAGTSGKTSTCYYIASLLKNAGYNVGLSVSPHIEKVSERAQINLKTLADNEYCELLSEFLALFEKSKINLTYFEILVAFAYWVFNKLSVDYAVMEVGLGGLLDGTNVVDNENKICVITDIGFDHVEILGNKLSDIALQKAGIIKHGNSVFMNNQPREVQEVIERTCNETNAKLNIAKNNKYPWLPIFQERNMNLAAAVCNYVFDKHQKNQLTIEQIQQSSKVSIPARFETINAGDVKIIMDGAHNDQKIGALVKSLKQKYPNSRVAVLASFGKNKETSVKKSLKILHEISNQIIFTEFYILQDINRSAISDDDLAGIGKEVGFNEIDKNSNPFVALNVLMSAEADIYLITGSFYLVSQIRPGLLSRFGLGNVEDHSI